MIKSIKFRHLALSTAMAFAATSAQAQSFLGIAAGAERVVCVNGSGNIYVINSSDDCTIDDPANVDDPTGLTVGNATFNETTNATTFIGGTVQVNAPMTVTGPTALNGTTTFGGPSVTFNTGTTFQNPATFNGTTNFTAGMTTTNITNSGTVQTATLSAGTIIGTDITASGTLRASAGTTVDMGNNVVTNVAAGVADTDAVNVGQLNAATSGIVTDVTALETLTATHTTQITALETVTSTHSTQISALQAAQDLFEGQIDTLFDLRTRDRRDMKQGVASAMAMAAAPMPSEPGRIAYAVNGATFRGEYAVGGSLTYRLNTRAPMAVNVGFSYAGNKNNGARIGFAGEF